MRASRWRWAAFAVLAVVQIAVLIWKIADCRAVLRDGVQARFACGTPWWSHGDPIKLEFYAARTPYLGGISKVDDFIKKHEQKENADDGDDCYLNDGAFREYPVWLAPNAQGLWEIAAYGDAALAKKEGGALMHLNLQFYNHKTKTLNFYFPFNVFDVSDTAVSRVSDALRLKDRDEESNPLSDYKGVLLVRFAKNGRWQIEDLLFEGKTVSIPANLSPLSPDKTAKNPCGE